MDNEFKFSARIDSINFTYQEYMVMNKDTPDFIPDSSPVLRGTVFLPGGHKMELEQRLLPDEQKELHNIINRVVSRSLDKFLNAIKGTE